MNVFVNVHYHFAFLLSFAAIICFDWGKCFLSCCVEKVQNSYRLSFLLSFSTLFFRIKCHLPMDFDITSMIPVRHRPIYLNFREIGRGYRVVTVYFVHSNSMRRYLLCIVIVLVKALLQVILVLHVTAVRLPIHLSILQITIQHHPLRLHVLTLRNVYARLRNVLPIQQVHYLMFLMLLLLHLLLLRLSKIHYLSLIHI